MTDCTSVYDTNFCPYLAFSYTKHELFASENTCRHILDASQSESDLHYFLAYKNTIMYAVRYGMISMATSPYLMFLNDVTVTSS